MALSLNRTKQWFLDVFKILNTGEGATLYDSIVAMKTVKTIVTPLGKSSSVVTECIYPNGEREERFLLKTLMQNDYPVVIHREAFIGMCAINDLAKEIPNFIQTACCYTKEGPSFGDEITLYAGPLKSPYMLVERVNSPTLKEYQTLLDSVEIANLIITQTILELSAAHERFGFLHNDVHEENILIQTLDDPIEIVYRVGGKKYTLVTHIVVRIIDYGMSLITKTSDGFPILPSDIDLFPESYPLADNIADVIYSFTKHPLSSSLNAEWMPDDFENSDYHSGNECVDRWLACGGRIEGLIVTDA